jgi:hypothetical protein
LATGSWYGLDILGADYADGMAHWHAAFETRDLRWEEFGLCRHCVEKRYGDYSKRDPMRWLEVWKAEDAESISREEPLRRLGQPPENQGE